MIGLLEFGEKRTQETHSVCPSSCLNKCNLKTFIFEGETQAHVFLQSKLSMDQIIHPPLLQKVFNFGIHEHVQYTQSVTGR